MNRKEIINIGKVLAKHSDDISLPELTQNELLAPYLVKASEAMTLRQISAFISERFEYSISPSTISRILNSKDEHYYKLASYLKKNAEWLAPMHERTASNLFVTQAELHHEEWSSPLANFYNDIEELLTDEPDSIILGKQLDVVSKLYDCWENLPDEAQHEILELMDFYPDE